MSLAMQISVLFFLVLDLQGVSLVYFPCTWVASLALLMNFLYLHIKKKNEKKSYQLFLDIPPYRKKYKTVYLFTFKGQRKKKKNNFNFPYFKSLERK